MFNLRVFSENNIMESRMSKSVESILGLGEIRNIFKYHQDASKTQPCFYQVDSPNVSQYFDKTNRKKILNYFSNLKEKGTSIIHLDICGKASVQPLGGDKSYCFSLNDESGTDWEGNVIFQGDLFSTNDFNKFLKEVDSSSDAPALITFRPIIGLQSNNPYVDRKDCPGLKEVTEAILEKRFGQCVGVLRKGGYIYIEKPFQLDDSLGDFLSGIPQKEYSLSRKIKSLAEKHHCNVKINSSLEGPNFLIRKRRN